MSLRSKAPLLASAVVASFGFATVAHAQAFYLQEQSARGAGRAFSGEVADTGPQSLWWNPAAIAGMDHGEAAIQASVILPKGKVVNNGTVIGRPNLVRPGVTYAPVGGDQVAKNPIDNGVLPSGAVAMPFGPVAIGLAVTSPYSFTTDYDSTSWTRYSATRTKLQTIDIQPSIAIALTDWLRVGGAANVEHVYASLGNALPNLSAALPDGRQKLEGDGWDLGWTAGMQMHNSWATVGVSYKSRIEHTLKGDLLVEGLQGPLLAGQNRNLSDIDASFFTPAQVIVGARIRATEALTLNGQAVRYNWSKFDAIRLGAPLNTALPENYHDSYSLAGGVDYAVSPQLTLRAGVQHATTPTTTGLRDARVPDSDRWNYGAGGTFQLTPRIGIDLAANYVDFKNTSIDRVTAAYAGTPLQTPVITNGLLQDAHAVVLSAGAHIGF